ncbi:MAG: hypothetical protein AAGC91_01170 [Pseudomonadota bacterium]
MSISNQLGLPEAVQKTLPHVSPQAQRVLSFIQAHPGQLTSTVAQECAVGNVSDACSKINLVLSKHGWVVVATQPHPLTKNRFGERSQQHRWSIERVR